MNDSSTAPFQGPSFEDDAAHAALILESFARVTGRALLSGDRAPDAARALYEAPFVVLTHAATADPCFTYGNRAALTLFEVTPRELLALRSRLSAEPVNQAERQRLLDEVSRRGFIDDYAGVRVSRTGRRFRIEGATVWNLVDREGHMRGQGATFAHWTPLG